MSRLIADEPGGYTEDEIRSALHSSFQEYLDSKSITLDEYETIMEKLLKNMLKKILVKKNKWFIRSIKWF